MVLLCFYAAGSVLCTMIDVEPPLFFKAVIGFLKKGMEYTGGFLASNATSHGRQIVHNGMEAQYCLFPWIRLSVQAKLKLEHVIP